MTKVESGRERPPHSPLYQVAEDAAGVYRGIAVETEIKGKGEVGREGRWNAFRDRTQTRFPQLTVYAARIAEVALTAGKLSESNPASDRVALGAFNIAGNPITRRFLADTAIYRASKSGEGIEDVVRQIKNDAGLGIGLRPTLTELVMDVFKGTIKTGTKTKEKHTDAA